MVGGALLNNYSVLRGDSSVMFTSYAPMGAHPTFYLGLILFAVGALIGCFVFFGTLVIAKNEKTYNGSVSLVTFGAITIHPKGLEYKGQFLHWDQMARIYVDAESDFVIERFGKTYPWCSLSSSRIPNFPVLLVLLEKHVYVDEHWVDLLYPTGEPQL